MDTAFMLWNSRPMAQFDVLPEEFFTSKIKSNIEYINTSIISASQSVNPAVISNYDDNAVYTIDEGGSTNDVKTIYIDNPMCKAKVKANRGTYVLDKYNPILTLYYFHNGWYKFGITSCPIYHTIEEQSISGVGGYSVSMYEDTLAVGYPTENGNIGGVYVYTRNTSAIPSSSWSLQAHLVGTGNVGGSGQGYSLSLFKDTIAVGGRFDNGNIGSCWVFIRVNGVWSQQARLVPSDPMGSPLFGHSVSLYNDTLVVGGPMDNSNIGATWVFYRSGTVWTQHRKLIGTSAIGSAQQGWSVSINKNTIAVGGPSNNSGVGCTWVFFSFGNVWTQQQRIVGSLGIGTSAQGSSVCVSDDTVVIGGPQDNSNAGCAWIYKRQGSTWLIESKVVGSGRFGASVSIYGGCAAIGSPDEGNGVVYEYTRSGVEWKLRSQLVGSIGVTQGSSISLYEDTVAIGNNQGDITIYT